MPKYYVHYWKNHTFNHYRKIGRDGKPLSHAAGQMFRNRGVGRGDLVYIVTLLSGKLFLVGKMEVARVCNVSEASAFLGDREESLWSGDDHIVAAHCTPQFYMNMIPVDVARSLRFHTNQGYSRLKLNGDKINGQTLRNIRELTKESAEMLDSFLPALQPFVPKQTA